MMLMLRLNRFCSSYFGTLDFRLVLFPIELNWRIYTLQTIYFLEFFQFSIFNKKNIIKKNGLLLFLGPFSGWACTQAQPISFCNLCTTWQCNALCIFLNVRGTMCTMCFCTVCGVWTWIRALLSTEYILLKLVSDNIQ